MLFFSNVNLLKIATIALFYAISLGFHYDPRLQDLWSIGVITYMMACGRIPFNPCNLKLMIRAQLRNYVKFPRKMEKMLSLSLKVILYSVFS